MIYYNKNGDKWGTPIPEFNTEKEKYTSLTIREAFNFSIGDTFWYKTHYVGTNPQNFECIESKNVTMRIIMDKWVSSKKDTTIYSIKDTGIGVATYKNMYTNLDSLVEFRERRDALSPFKYFRDTTNYENNVKFTYISHSYGGIASISRRFVAGLGEIFTRIGDDTQCRGNVPAGFTEELIYFKNGQKEWGNKNLISPISTPSVFETKMSLSPNPVSEMLHIDVDMLDFDVKIVSLQGQILKNEKNSRAIDVSQLPNSIYFLQIYDKGVLRGVRKFVVRR